MVRQPFQSGARPFSRPSGKSQDELRRDWVRALDAAAFAAGDAKAMAEGAQDAPSGAPGQWLTRLAASLRDLAPDNFPVPGFAARVVAGAWLMKARAFAHPVGNAPEARGVLAAPLGSATGHLSDLMDELRRREAQHGQRVLGERDD